MHNGENEQMFSSLNRVSELFEVPELLDTTLGDKEILLEYGDDLFLLLQTCMPTETLELMTDGSNCTDKSSYIVEKEEKYANLSLEVIDVNRLTVTYNSHELKLKFADITRMEFLIIFLEKLKRTDVTISEVRKLFYSCYPEKLIEPVQKNHDKDEVLTFIGHLNATFKKYAAKQGSKLKIHIEPLNESGWYTTGYRLRINTQ